MKTKKTPQRCSNLYNQRNDRSTALLSTKNGSSNDVLAVGGYDLPRGEERKIYLA